MENNNMNLDSFKLKTAKEVANHLILKESTIKEYRRLGKLPAKKIGGRYLYLERDVINFILNS